MKKSSKIILIVVLLIVGIIVIDTIQAKIFNNSPIISFKEKLEDSDSWVDKGILINTYYCVKEKDIVTVHLENKFSKFSCPIDNKEIQNNESKINERIIKVREKIYYDTGEESTVGARCGNMDGYINSSVERDEIPSINDQSNFGIGYGYQYIDDTIEVQIDGKFIVFKQK